MTYVARLKGLGYYDAGSRSFYTTDAAIRTPDDLIGNKVGYVPGNTGYCYCAVFR